MIDVKWQCVYIGGIPSPTDRFDLFSVPTVGTSRHRIALSCPSKFVVGELGGYGWLKTAHVTEVEEESVFVEQGKAIQETEQRTGAW